MTFPKSRAVSTLTSFVAAMVLFLPLGAAAQTQNSTDPGALAVTPNVFRFAKPFDDRSARMTTDAAGDFYIAASFDDLVHPNAFGVLKYRVDGKLLGAFHFKKAFAAFANDVKVDANGNIYAGGTGAQGGLIVSFDQSGKTRWSRVLGDVITTMALDQSGNVYAGGTINQTSMLVAKFAADGSLLWQTSHHGTTATPCGFGALTPGSCVTDMKLDDNGNVIAFGFSTNAGPNTDNTTLKINPQGKLLWARNFTQQPQFNKVPAAGVVDHDNGIYATGQGVDPFTGQRFPYTLKYDTNGKLIFALTGAGNGGVAVAVDPAGKILLSGFTFFQGNPVSTASKLDPSGKQIWAIQIPGSGQIVSDAKGNVFASASGYAVTKLNPAGTILWTFRESSQFTEFTTTGSVVDPSGNLIVTGTGFDFNVGQNDIITLKFPRNSKPQSGRLSAR
jgi:sugar lactone lactonase YvrE